MSIIRRTVADEPYMLVRSLASEADDGHAIERHVHGWGQLIYCATGVMTVWTEHGTWVAPSHWAVWVPAGVRHGIRFSGRCALRTLYLRADLADGMGDRCAVTGVTPLLRELILRAVGIGMLDARAPVEAAMARLIRAELDQREAASLELPTPTSPSARRAAELLSAPASRLTIAEAARQIGLSPRALERRFLSETGMTIARWRRQAQLHQALRRLAGGEPVKAAALAAGYAAPSAFVAAFRQTLGVTPGRYFSV